MRLALLIPVAVASVTACAEFPDLDQRITPELAAAPVPALVPIGPIIAQAQTTPHGGDTLAAGLAGRIAALNARATALRGPVIPPTARTRMLRGVR